MQEKRKNLKRDTFIIHGLKQPNQNWKNQQIENG
jgi:hypothetical protein